MTELKIGDSVEIINFYSYYTENEIPKEKELIIHGTVSAAKNPNAKIVDIHNEYYIVNYTNSMGKQMQLGYLAKDLRLIKSKEEEILHNLEIW